MKNLKTQIANWLANANPNSSDRELLGQLKKIVYETEQSDYQFKETSDFATLAIENIETIEHPTTGNSIETGFQSIDKEQVRFNLGEFIVIGGRPAMGKSQLLINLALNISQKMPVLYYTFDMSDIILSQRMLATITSVSTYRMQRNDLKEDEKSKIKLAQSNLNQFQLYINDSSVNSVSAFREHCETMIEEKGIKVIFIDYIQLMNSKRFSYRGNRETEISYISRTLKDIARDFNVCIIVSSQLSRAVEVRGGDKRPILSDLRESGAIEQDADKVIFLYRHEYYGILEDEDGMPTQGTANLIIAKNRNGSTGTVKLRFIGKIPTFTDLDEYQNEFSFSTERLGEIDDFEKQNPLLKEFKRRFGTDEEGKTDQ